MTLRIELPGLPPKECSPNARVHWAVKAKAAAAYRETVRIIAQSFARAYSRTEVSTSFALGRPLPRAVVSVTFVVPDRRRRDKTNLAASFKAGLDGIVDAGIIVDDSHEHCDDQYHVKYEKGVSQTIVEVKEGA
jgi:crossover junction endodeoxyribonuclease RusA